MSEPRRNPRTAAASRGRRPASRPPATPAASSAWDRQATWYDGWVGGQGSRYHRGIVVPTALELLDPREGEEILDVGAGQGVLAPSIVRAGARYTGVDASPRLIDAARRRHGRAGRFIVADARRLSEVQELQAGSFDAAVFVLSIQDMDPLGPVFESIDWALRPTSRLVIVMTHPAFRQPRHSGWGFDEGRKLTYRRVDAYLTPMAVPMKSVSGSTPTRSFHRPLSDYVNGLAWVGFAVDGMLEPGDLPEGERPGKRPGRGAADAEIPLFLALRARRGG
jgi:SAM-dependent methyltransferase